MHTDKISKYSYFAAIYTDIYNSGKNIQMQNMPREGRKK